jgi:tRNA A37 threonylcarbamoyltransferase TsaD
MFAGLNEGDIIPGVEDLCASFQLCIARHLCHRLQRAMEFSEKKGLIPEDAKSFVRI